MFDTERVKAAQQEALKQPGMVLRPDGSLYDWGTSKEEYLTRQCAMLADWNCPISAQDLYEIEPAEDKRYSEQDIQAWLDAHPNYAAGLY